MTEKTNLGVTRRGLLGVFAATVVAAAPTYSNAFGLLRGAGDIRRIRMYSGRTGESLDTIYWIEGDYIPEVMKEINHFMRDWRSNDKISIDNRTIDIMAAAHSLMGCDRTLHAPLRLSQPRDQRDAAQPLLRRGTQFPAHERSGRRPAPEIPLGQPDGPRGRGLRLGRRGALLALQLRPHGLRPDPPLGRLTPPPKILRPKNFRREDFSYEKSSPRVSHRPPSPDRGHDSP